MGNVIRESAEGPDPSPDLRWLADLLWGPGGAQLVTEAPASFVVVRSRTDARFLVPVASRRAAAGSLLAHNALRPPVTRLARWALAAAFRTGSASLLLRDRLRVSRGPLDAKLHEVFGRDDLTFAVGVGAAGPNRKPTLRVLALSGEPLGFVKLGWNDFTRNLVRHEAEGLEAVARAGLAGVAAPRPLYAGSWNGLELSVASPLPAAVRRHRPRRPPAARATLEVARIGGVDRVPLGASDYVRALRFRLTADVPRGDEGGQRALAALDRVLDRAGDREVEVGTWHGDWTPWNLAWHRATLFALDWEHWGRAPVGFDLLHYTFATEFFGRGWSPDRAAGAMRARAFRWLEDLGVPGPVAAPLGVVYLLELLARAFDARRAGAGVNPRLWPALLETIEEAGHRRR